MNETRALTLILILAVLTPGIPEYLTGSTPITVLFTNPVQFLASLMFDVGLYTTGVLLIREFVVRFKKGWPSILLLGAAYGIIEEGLAVHTFFQTSGNPVGLLATYGHVLGINLVWAIALTVFHSLYSVALPLLILELAYPDWKGKTLLKKRGLITVALIYVMTVLALNSYAGYKPTNVWYASLIAFVLLLVYFAFKITKANITSTKLRSVIDFDKNHSFWAGTMAFTAYFVYALLLPSMKISPVLDTIIYIPLILVAIVFFLSYAGQQDYEKEKFFFISGMMAILILWAEIVELAGIARGITLVSMIAIILLHRLKRISARYRKSKLCPLGVDNSVNVRVDLRTKKTQG